MSIRLVLRSVLVAVAIQISAVPATWAQDVSARIKEASRSLALSGAAIGHLDGPQRERIVEFVAGNALFTLGREEDAADSFATLALLHVGTDFTHRVLVDAARGLLLIGERDARMGVQPT